MGEGQRPALTQSAEEVRLFTGNALIALSIDDGKPVWRLMHPRDGRGTTSPTPLVMKLIVNIPDLTSRTALWFDPCEPRVPGNSLKRTSTCSTGASTSSVGGEYLYGFTASSKQQRRHMPRQCMMNLVLPRARRGKSNDGKRASGRASRFTEAEVSFLQSYQTLRLMRRRPGLEAGGRSRRTTTGSTLSLVGHVHARALGRNLSCGPATS